MKLHRLDLVSGGRVLRLNDGYIPVASVIEKAVYQYAPLVGSLA